MPTILLSLPVFLIIGAGWGFARFKVSNAVWVHILNQFAYYVALPALIIVSFWGLQFSDAATLSVLGWSVLIMTVYMALVLLVLSLTRFSLKTKGALFLIVTTGNTVYMGFPLVSAFLGKSALAHGSLVAVVYLILPLLVSIGVVKAWAHHHRSWGAHFVDFVKNPLFVSSVLGVVMSFVARSGIAWVWIHSSLSLLAATASPVALFALGSFLYKRFLRRDVLLVSVASVIKVMALPVLLVVLGALSLGQSGALLVLLATMPVAVTTFVIAEKFSLNETLVGNALLVSTVLSFFVIPFVAQLL